MATSNHTSTSSSSSNTEGLFSPEDSSDYDSEEDLCGTREEADSSKIQVRVEEYLNASKLGRLAYAAGDVQLAKDRFNLALNLEMQTELESFADFGVTGGQLRAELQRRSSESDVLVPVEKSRDKYTAMLTKLERVYARANSSASRSPDDPKLYLQMGATLCIINEWDRAKQVYRSGIASCRDNERLKACLEQVNKLDDMIALVSGGGGKGKETMFSAPKHSNSSNTLIRRSHLMSHRPNSLYDLNIENARIPRSSSFGNSEHMKNLRKSKPVNIPQSPVSPLSIKRSLPSDSLDTPDSPLLSLSTSRRVHKSLSAAFSKVKKRGTIPLLFKSNRKSSISMERSPSNEELSKESEERAVWQNSFSPDFCSLTTEDSKISSQTLEYMRAMNSVDHQLSSPSPDREL